MSKIKISYFINEYPKVSHTFIRREILALERLGFEIQRIAVRGWNTRLVDVEDIREREKTRYVLKDGVTGLILAVMKTALTRPMYFFRALQLALKMGIRADRPLPFHLIYLAEACLIVSWMNNFGSRHVHAHFGNNSTEVVMLASALGGPPYSMTVHGSAEWDRPEFLRIGEKARHAAFVVTVCSFGRSQMYRWSRYADWPKVHVVHCGLDKTFYDVPSVPFPTIRRLVSVGRLCKEKGQMLLLDAMKQLELKGINFELVFAGDGEMRPDLEALISQYNLQTKVRITGWISGEQVREEILASSGLVLPSFAESLPVVVMEAMALRRPVLATYVGGIPELVLPRENGWLYPAGDVEALTNVIEDFINTPNEILEKMGEAGHSRAVERHSIDIEARKLDLLFRTESKVMNYV